MPQNMLEFSDWARGANAGPLAARQGSLAWCAEAVLHSGCAFLARARQIGKMIGMDTFFTVICINHANPLCLLRKWQNTTLQHYNICNDGRLYFDYYNIYNYYNNYIYYNNIKPLDQSLNYIVKFLHFEFSKCCNVWMLYLLYGQLSGKKHSKD